jgi:hypothetical protein
MRVTQLKLRAIKYCDKYMFDKGENEKLLLSPKDGDSPGEVPDDHHFHNHGGDLKNLRRSVREL